MPKCFIVAECGVNWSGDPTKAKIMIDQAKRAGADAVKFQAFTSEQVRDHPRYKDLERCSITLGVARELIRFSRERGIDWFCTPMYLGAVDMLRALGVTRFKIRYRDWMASQPMFKDPTDLLSDPTKAQEAKEAVEAKTLIDACIKYGKEVFISCERPSYDLEYSSLPHVKWLYATPKYPFPMSSFNPSRAFMFNGISDHCPGFLATLTAATVAFSRGEERFIVEKHFTLDHKNKDIDDNVSLDPQEFKMMVGQLRTLEEMNWKVDYT